MTWRGPPGLGGEGWRRGKRRLSALSFLYGTISQLFSPASSTPHISTAVNLPPHPPTPSTTPSPLFTSSWEMTHELKEFDSKMKLEKCNVWKELKKMSSTECFEELLHKLQQNEHHDKSYGLFICLFGCPFLCNMCLKKTCINWYFSTLFSCRF